MALESYTISQLDHWLEQLKTVAKEIATVKSLLEENKLDSVRLEATRASDCLDYIHSWGFKSNAKAREEIARHRASLLKSNLLNPKNRTKRQ